MATFGQGINASLGRIDYTPYMQGAMQGSQMMGQGLAKLGQTIGEGMKEYHAKKEEKQLSEQLVNGLSEVDSKIPGFLKSLGITAKPGDPEFNKQSNHAIKLLGGPRAAYPIMLNAKKEIEVGLARKQQEDKFRSDVQSALSGNISPDIDPKALEFVANLQKTRAETMKIGSDVAQAGQPRTDEDPNVVGSAAWKRVQDVRTADVASERSAAKDNAATIAAVNEEKVKAEKFKRGIETNRADLLQRRKTLVEAKRLAESGVGGPIEGRLSGLLAVGGAMQPSEAISQRMQAPEVLESLLETARAGAKLDKLLELKELSPNGASGLGALSDTEGKALETSYTNLRGNLPTKALLKNLDDAINRTDRFINALNQDLGIGKGPRIVSVEPLN